VCSVREYHDYMTKGDHDWDSRVDVESAYSDSEVSTSDGTEISATVTSRDEKNNDGESTEVNKGDLEIGNMRLTGWIPLAG
jgi:hypothetical protein